MFDYLNRVGFSYVNPLGFLKPENKLLNYLLFMFINMIMNNNKYLCIKMNILIVLKNKLW